MYDLIVHNGFQPILIATKLDKINRSQIAKQSKLIRTSLKMPKDGILIPFSAETKQGLDEIWSKIEEMLPQEA